jgi:branched-subunit amino acid transport protein
MEFWRMIGSIAVMAVVTYATRVIPLVLLRKDITNVYIRSFLTYIPYAVLGCMTLPAILYSTSSIISAAAGLLVAAILAYKEKSLLTVAASACMVVFVVEKLL